LVNTLFRWKQTLFELVIDDEDNEFPMGSMVIKGEYLTLATQQKMKDGYLYQDYKPVVVVYHFTNLIVSTNIKLHTLSKKKRHMYDTSYLTPIMRN
jgi:hypothetical protein